MEMTFTPKMFGRKSPLLNSEFQVVEKPTTKNEMPWNYFCRNTTLPQAKTDLQSLPNC